MDRRTFLTSAAAASTGIYLSALSARLSAAPSAGSLTIPGALLPAGSPATIPGSPVAFDRHSLFINGKRRLILSGSLHYFRAPDPELWKDRIASLKSVGLNAIDTYFFWGYHSPAAGKYEFTGTRDVDRFMDLVEEAGMYLIARPGPYICAEVDGGGLPGWLIAKSELKLRCRTPEGGYSYDPEYIKYVREWFEQIVPRIARRKNLILFQTENEYNLPGGLSKLLENAVKLTHRIKGATEFYFRLGTLPAIRNAGVSRQLQAMRQPTYLSSCQYLQDLYRLSRELGVTTPIFHNDTSMGATRWIDVDIPGVDDYPVTYMTEEWKKRDPFGPIDIMEQGLEALARDDPHMIERKLYCNVDYYSAPLLYYLGIDPDLFTSMFAMARIVGWIGHLLEQYADNRLIRPRSEYVGAENLHWTPTEQR